MLHLAAEGGYERFPEFKKCYKFNFVKSKKLIHNSYKQGCKKFIIVGTKKEQIFTNFKITKKKLSIIKKNLIIHMLLVKQFFRIIAKISL